MKVRQFLAASALSFVLGSLHAYSVLLEPLESFLSASRGTVSLAYSLAILSLTTGVVLSGHIFTRLEPRRAALLSGLGAAFGLVLASVAHSVTGLLLGFGIFFGFCNGIGYALFLQEAAIAMPDRKGLAIGVVTAIYGSGAMVFSFALDAIVTNGNVDLTLLVLAMCVAIGGGAAFLGFSASRMEAAAGKNSERFTKWLAAIRYWLVYFCGAAGGLMVIGHAAGLLREAGSASPAWASAIIALGNVLGSLFGGQLADLWSARLNLALANALSVAAIIALFSLPGPMLSLMWLAVIGFAYGALISLVPALLSHGFARATAAAMFSRVFTAWGIAGLMAPWAAGVLFDQTGNYRSAIILAAGVAGLAVVLALLLPEKPVAP